MADSKIEWTDATWNPTVGCRACSSGCANCYAEVMSNRLSAMAAKDITDGKNPGKKRNYLNVISEGKWKGNVELVLDALNLPLGWRKPKKIFVNSMSDLFYGNDADRRACESKGIAFEPVPFDFVDKVFAVMAMCPQHTFQILTKRPDRMAEYFAGINDGWVGDDGDASGTDPAHRLQAGAGTLLDGTWIWGEGKQYRNRIDSFITDCAGSMDGFNDDDPDREFKPVYWPLRNVWLGTSVENQEAADKRIPHLLKVPAAVRFLSCEPLLGPIAFKDVRGFNLCGQAGVDLLKSFWIIIGGESGPGSRPCNIEWVRDIVRQCKISGVPCFYKQGGASNRCEHNSKGGCFECFPHDLKIREFPCQTQTH